MSDGFIIKQISQRGRRLSEATADASLFSRRGGEVRSSRQQKPSCLLDGYSLALEEPKAVSTKRVGLKRDTEETSVFFSEYCKWSAFGKHVIVFCSCQFILIQRGHCDCGPEGRRGTKRWTNGVDRVRNCTMHRPIRSFLKHHVKECNHGDKMDWRMSRCSILNEVSKHSIRFIQNSGHTYFTQKR